MIYAQWIVFALLLFVSCKDNPYPEEGNITKIEPLGARRADVYSIIPEKFHMIFSEGSQSEYDIEFNVPDGRPVVSFEGLPQGAFFDESLGKLIWHPDYEAANVDRPSDQSKIYGVSITLHSTVDSITAIHRRITMEVLDTVRNFSLASKYYTHSTIEGNLLSVSLEVLSDDFPQGPFSIQAQGLPLGAEIVEESSKNIFQLRYKPDHNVVNLKKDSKDTITCNQIYCSKRFRPVFTITAPNGRTIKQEVSIIVRDVRLPPLYGTSAEIELEAPRGGTFYFSAYDQNLETKPFISSTYKPNFGKFKIEKLNNEGDYYGSTLKIDWREIPLVQIGKDHNFQINVCVQKTLSVKSHCDRKNIKVKVTKYDSLPPDVNREDWARGEIKFLPFNANQSFDVYFQIGARSLSDISILPEEMSEMVSLSYGGRGSYGHKNIRINATTTGLHQFQLAAVSATGNKRIESFIFEVFPESRSNTIYLSDSSRDPSRSYYQSLGGANYYSPLFLPDSKREMIYRDKIILAGDILDVLPTFEPDSSLHTFFDDILSGEKYFKRIFIAAPNLENLPDNFKQKLESMGAFLEPQLKSAAGWNVTATAKSGLKRPTQHTSLRGTFSAASSTPTPLRLSLTNSECTGLIILENNRIEHHGGIECPLDGNRKLIVSGFEWGDINLSPEEQELSKSWYDTLMTIEEK